MPLRYPPLPDAQDVQHRRGESYLQTAFSKIMENQPAP